MLNDAEPNPLARLIDWRDQIMEGTNEFDRDAVYKAADALYAAYELQAPNVIFCDGPLHMTALICLTSRLPNCSFWNASTLNFERSVAPADQYKWLTIYSDTLIPLLRESPLYFLMRCRDGWGALGTSLYRTIFGNPGRIVQTVQTLQTRGFGDAAIRLGHIFETSNTGHVPDELTAETLGGRRFLAQIVERGIRDHQGEVAFNNIIRAQALPFANWLRDFWVAKPELASALRPQWVAELEGLITLALNCHSVFFTIDTAFVCRKPTQVHLDHAGRAHHTVQPAITFSDGFYVNAVCGVRVPDHVLPISTNLKVQDILNEQNVEVRRAYIEVFGAQRFLYEYGGTLIDSSEFGELYRTTIRGDEDLVMVRVRNSTAEPDGSYKWYCLRVPPIITTAREAIAWTFDLAEQEYAPNKET